MTPHITLPDAPVFFTADHHFGHKNIGTLCARPFQNSALMDAEMIDRWNATVPPNGHVIHLGDFSLSMRAAETVRPHLNGTITLIAGNHEPWWGGHPKQNRAALRRAEAAFDQVIPEGRATLTLSGTVILASHLPYHGDSHHDDRYTDRRPTDAGLPLVCGHVHNTWAHLYGGNGRTHRGQINVGVDVWDYTPVPADTLSDLIGDHQ